jgi:1,6-anhydro-N-acetylmuramate kinase
LNSQYQKSIIRQFVNLQKNTKLILSNCDAVSIHGQTVWHQPEQVNFGDISISSTLQLGNASYLAKKTGLKVISDFRSGDIALGRSGGAFGSRIRQGFFVFPVITLLL